MKVEENGWPTLLPARGYEEQASRLRRMVRAVHDFRGTYNVSDYRWFNLRDGDTRRAGACSSTSACSSRTTEPSRRSGSTASSCAASAGRARVRP